MADNRTIQATIDRYVAAFSAGDRGGWLACFAPDATLEDPVGSDVRHGHESIGEFWDVTQSMADSPRMERTGPVRIAAGQAAWPFRIIVGVDGTEMAMPVIDVMTFDDDGAITSMRAFWDMSDMSPVEG